VAAGPGRRPAPGTGRTQDLALHAAGRIRAIYEPWPLREVNEGIEEVLADNAKARLRLR
jgi:hypothetical protein